jgi:hypothetical protein
MELTRLRRSATGYPPLLAQLHDPPAELYVRGNPTLLGETAVAVVGARNCSPYGSQVARSLARELAAAGVVVVSGLARGIDGEAHRGTLEADGRTVAVLGCGIDRDYPRSHTELARRIRERGAVLSEYPPGVEPAPWRFPARKRKSYAFMRNACKSLCRCCRAGRQTLRPWCLGGVSRASPTAATGGIRRASNSAGCSLRSWRRPPLESAAMDAPSPTPQEEYPTIAFAAASLATIFFPLIALIVAALLLAGQRNERKRAQLTLWLWASAGLIVLEVLFVLLFLVAV